MAIAAIAGTTSAAAAVANASASAAVAAAGTIGTSSALVSNVKLQGVV